MGNMAKQTILVCDDDREIVEAIDIYLQQEGYEVLKAYDGEEALEMLKEHEVHLLIMVLTESARRSKSGSRAVYRSSFFLQRRRIQTRSSGLISVRMIMWRSRLIP